MGLGLLLTAGWHLLTDTLSALERIGPGAGDWGLAATGWASGVVVTLALYGRVRRREELPRGAAPPTDEDERFRLLAESIPQIVFTARADGSVEWFNRRWYETTGLTEQRSLGWEWQAALHPGELDRFLRGWRRAVEIGRAHEVACRIRRATDGTWRWHLCRAQPLRGEDGRIVRWFGTCTDIDDQKRTAEAQAFLLRAGHLLALSLDYETTLSTIARLAVPEFADWCSVEVMEEGGRSRPLAVAHRDPEKAPRARSLAEGARGEGAARRGVAHVLAAGRPDFCPDLEAEGAAADLLPAEARLLAELGTRSYIVVPLASGARTFGAITFALAESGRRYTPTDLDLAEDLARRAALAIDHARLYAASREENQRKDRFLAMLGHELRHPLASVAHALRILDEAAPEGGSPARPIEVIARQTRHISRLVDDLLDVSRIRVGKVALRRQPTDLAALVSWVCESLRPSADARGQDLSLAVPEEPVWVDGDPDRLEQVVANLLDNAVKYTPPGGWIRLEVDRAGAEALLRVRDGGAGIEPAILPRIFDLFTQAESTLHRAQGGLGVGLALVRGLVELHGGAVSAESAGRGQGSTFTVRLPLGQAPAGQAVRPLPRPVAASRRILVVEDNGDARETLRQLLAMQGHRVEVAEDGIRGLEAALRSVPDVALIDLGLPGLDGLQLARRLREAPEGRGVRLIAVTGYGSPEDRQRALEAGFDAHLVKPVDLEDLAQVLG